MAPKKSVKTSSGSSKQANIKNSKAKKAKNKKQEDNEPVPLDFLESDVPLTRSAWRRINTLRMKSERLKIDTEFGTHKKGNGRHESSQNINVNSKGYIIRTKNTCRTSGVPKRKSDLGCKTRKVAVTSAKVSEKEKNQLTQNLDITMQLNESEVEEDCCFQEEICDINRLPPEMLTKIFTFLSIRDRKNVRLVCRRWFDAHNITQFLFQERLLCYGLYDINVIIETLTRSKRKLLNVEFYDITFTDALKSFWQQCGAKIGSLFFSDCMLSDQIVAEIIVNCDKLESLSLENMSKRSDGQKICSAETLVRLTERGVIRKSLSFIELNISDSGWVSNSLLTSLFTIYPQIKQFSFYCDTVADDFSVDLSDEEILKSDSICTFSGILKKLKDSATELDTISLDFGDYLTLNDLPATFICEKIMPLHFTRLKDIQMDIGLTSMSECSIIDFFARHKQLENVECQILIESAQFTDQFLKCLLDCCPNLLYLELLQEASTSYVVNIDSTVFTKLVESRVETLTLNFTLDISLPKVPAVNHTLRSITTYSPVVHKDMFLVLSKTFRGLTHLELTTIDDDILQSILQYQRNLTSLKLTNCDDCCDYGFTGCLTSAEETNDVVPRGYSIDVLQKLEYLELKMSSDVTRITRKAFSKFVFPNLLYLHVTISTAQEQSNIEETHAEFLSPLIQTFYNFPKLEGLSFNGSLSIDYGVWLDLCSSLKGLRYLHIEHEDDKTLSDAEFELIFKRCPSLRAFQYRNNAGYLSYYYDTIEKKISKKNTNQDYRISSERIDTFSVNWMWF